MTLELHDRHLRVRVAGFTADFHYRWLRHNSDGDRHPLTGERILDSSELAPDVRPERAELDELALRIAWTDGARSTYPLAFLCEHAYARDRVEVARPPSDVAGVELHAAGLSLDEVARRALALGEAHGVAIARGVDGDPAEVTEPLVRAFERLRLPLVETHFGRIEDLRPDNTTNQNTDQLGYTDAGIELHTDQPFLDHPPRWQLLQAVVPAEHGGDTAIVDAQAAAEYLRSLDARAYELLTAISVRFHRRQKQFERTVVAPILVPEGPRGFQVRYSYFTLAPHRVPFAHMEEWYAAYDRFARLVRDPRHQRRFRLERGDFVLYDNLRMLHARTAFTGARWLRGIYFDEPAA